MKESAKVAVVIPAFNEEQAIGKVISAVPRWVDDVIVVDNGSTDGTADAARHSGARVVSEPRRGYGSACLAGIAALSSPDVVVFLDGDFSDRPEEMEALVGPILDGGADIVIGSRVLGQREAGALSPQARFGNMLACFLIRLFWRRKHTDLGPFRAVRYSALKCLGMCDRDYGWTVEMQIKAIRRRLRVHEVPVSYRRRIGKSKISGTVTGVIAAGTKILSTIFLAVMDSRRLSAAGDLHELLVIFSRYPEPGRAKTRLIPVLGPEGAADLQRRMTIHTVTRAKELERRDSVSIELRFEGGDEARMRQWLGPDLTYRSQGRGDLGERMARAFLDGFQSEAERVVIVGTDCPSLTAALVRRAFDLLGQNDLVLGPANDGGYYLMGLRRRIPQLFSGIRWGTGEVLEKTLRIAQYLGISVALLETLDDVDRPEDLAIWEKASGPLPVTSTRQRISVIIPTFNEVSEIATALSCLSSVDVDSAGDVEVIVVDGGSTDGTVDVVRSHGAKLLSSPPGRAGQMNAGAAAATGDVLLFLHADTRLPSGFAHHLRRTLDVSGAVAGAFEFGIDAAASGRASLRLVERLANFRSRRMQMPYGDEAIFVRVDAFHEMGGFPDLPIMEDFELMRRLRRRGRIAIVPLPAVTSGRRWLTQGVWRTTLINQAVIAGYYMGISPSRLARWYNKPGKKSVPEVHP